MAILKRGRVRRAPAALRGKTLAAVAFVSAVMVGVQPAPAQTVVAHLRIDQANGQMEIRNDNAIPVALSAYEITSPSSGLDTADWRRISSQYYAGFPVGNGEGDGWEPGPNPSNAALIEWFLTGSSPLAPGTSVKIGSAYNQALDATDLVFKYTSADGIVITSPQIEFAAVTAPPNPADFNNDTLVDITDLGILRSNFDLASTKATGDANGDGRTDGRDFLIWQHNVGLTPAVAAGGAVPEPSAALLFALGSVVLVVRRARSHGRVSPRDELEIKMSAGGGYVARCSPDSSTPAFNEK